MAPKPRVLVAAQPGAWLILQSMLDEVADLKPAHTSEAALKILESDSPASELILSTIAFDDSRLVEFLYAVKSRERSRAMPFVCCRVLPTVLSGGAVTRLAEVCMLGGAAEFIDIPSLDANSAAALLGAALMRHIEAARGANRAA